MMEILSFMFLTGGGLVMFFIAAFSETWIQRILALIGGILYAILGFIVAESVSIDVRREKKTSDKRIILLLTLLAFVINYYALSSYLKNYFAPLLLVGPGLIVGLKASVGRRKRKSK
ncbi:MAG: hypothetical protein PWP39_1134 [Pyrococcus sp.]|uniref:hypothetical protein n=1 Tax=Pyrococcus sp. TaxID=33866 RepID=UPI00258B6A62|nr:hypothetical protein [Pyrococcus sp.]MDK2869899.1 hypothetical protein [Pyrococcus sp.]